MRCITFVHTEFCEMYPVRSCRFLRDYTQVLKRGIDLGVRLLSNHCSQVQGAATGSSGNIEKNHRNKRIILLPFYRMWLAKSIQTDTILHDEWNCSCKYPIIFSGARLLITHCKQYHMKVTFSSSCSLLVLILYIDISEIRFSRNTIIYHATDAAYLHKCDMLHIDRKNIQCHCYRPILVK